jgi:pimeloyl-ACP methyl ester carboxylesterase
MLHRVIRDSLHVTPLAAEATHPTQGILVIHGIYGRGRNWAAVMRRIVARKPAWGAWLVDLRLHGDSPAFEPPHTVAAAAGDIVRLVEAGGAVSPGLSRAHDASARAVLGHSFGGKVALALAEPLAGTLEQIWVVDSTPERRPPDGSAWRMLEVVRALPATFASRADAVAALESLGVAGPVAQWMATNLRHDGSTFRWALDFDAMESLLRDFFATDYWAVVEAPPPGVELHFVKAESSSTLTEPACARIQAAGDATGRVHLHRVPGGHWLNTDNPGALVDLLGEYLP